MMLLMRLDRFFFLWTLWNSIIANPDAVALCADIAQLVAA
jgi:hypothetical protein